MILEQIIANLLEEATQSVTDLRQATAKARADEDAALNNLNKIQQAVDDAIAEIKMTAPQGSRWWKEIHHKPAPTDQPRPAMPAFIAPEEDGE